MNAVVAYATCAKIWNHPDNLYNAATKNRSALFDFEEDLEDLDPVFPETSKKKRPPKKKDVKDSESDDWIRNCGIVRLSTKRSIFSKFRLKAPNYGRKQREFDETITLSKINFQ